MNNIKSPEEYVPFSITSTTSKVIILEVNPSIINNPQSEKVWDLGNLPYLLKDDYSINYKKWLVTLYSVVSWYEEGAKFEVPQEIQDGTSNYMYCQSFQNKIMNMILNIESIIDPETPPLIARDFKFTEYGNQVLGDLREKLTEIKIKAKEALELSKNGMILNIEENLNDRIKALGIPQNNNES